MFTDLETFVRNYAIKNNEIPNEVTLNRASVRLKREIRELKSMLDILIGRTLDEWNSSKYYEVDEYVSYANQNYKSKINGNHGLEPGVSSEWELVTIDTIRNGSDEIGSLSAFSEYDTQTDDTYNIDDIISSYTIEEQ